MRSDLNKISEVKAGARASRYLANLIAFTAASVLLSALTGLTDPAQAQEKKIKIGNIAKRCLACT